MCHEDKTACDPWKGCSPENCDNVKPCAEDDKECLEAPKPECKDDGSFCPIKPSIVDIRRERNKLNRNEKFFAKSVSD